MKEEFGRYFRVGIIPVRSSYKGKGRPYEAEVPDPSGGGMKIDNLYLGEVDDGEDVTELSLTEFDEELASY